LGYTQSPPLTKEEIEAVLKEATVARFCSFNKDGTIHAAPIWFMYKDGKIIMGTPAASQKARNVKRNSKVTVLIDVEGPPVKGVLIYGEAELNHDYTFEEAIALYEKYMPRLQAEKFAQTLIKESKGGGAQIIVKPHRIVSFDYGKDPLIKSIQA